MTEEKPFKFAFDWNCSCGGCSVAILDINEAILLVHEKSTIYFWPCALDGKVADVEAMEDNFLDVAFINGSINNDDQLHRARLLRAKSKFVVAFGSCAHLGGIPALANVTNRAEIEQEYYVDSVSLEPGSTTIPGPSSTSNVDNVELTLPNFYDSVRALDQVIPVDFYLPGCPPQPPQIVNAVLAIFDGTIAGVPKGTVLGPDKSLCDECPRERQEKHVGQMYRPYEIEPDAERCLLEQGLLCVGPATRAGCEAACISANMPCRGCNGPVPGVEDQAAKMIGALGSILDAETDEELDIMLDQVVDPLGTFNRFSLSKSMLYRTVLPADRKDVRDWDF